jgi:2-methylisocitrate lyase-like PEP mutase family enzyme
MLKNPGKALRELLSEPGIVMAPGIYDGISARVTEQAGFKAGYLSGAGRVATSGIGEPDIGLTTLDDR